MLPKLIRLSFAVLFVLASKTEVDAQQTLRWKFADGQSFQIRFEQTTTTETSGVGKDTGINMRMQMGMTWDVESVQQGGDAQITQQFDSLKLSMKSGKAEAIEYDSTSNEPPAGAAATIAAGVKPLLGARFNVSMTARGAIRDVTLPAETAAALQEIDTASIKQLFSAEGITTILRQSAVELPEQAVDAGDMWEVASETKTPLGLLKQTQTYKLVGQVDSAKKITVSAELELVDATNKLELLDQSGSGTLLFDSELGRIVRSEATQKLTTERPYREFKIKVVTTSTSVMTIDSK